LVFDAHTQGSSFLATLGFATESLWDSKMSKLHPWDESHGYLRRLALRGQSRQLQEGGCAVALGSRQMRLAICLGETHMYPIIFRPFMADIANRYSDNVAGKFYVDNQCIDCDLCRETAPNNFTRNDDGGYSYVYKQPDTPDEETQCKEAMEGCPVEAIGNNGDAP
jgi:ferredoxin